MAMSSVGLSALAESIRLNFQVQRFIGFQLESVAVAQMGGGKARGA